MKIKNKFHCHDILKSYIFIIIIQILISLIKSKLCNNCQIDSDDPKKCKIIDESLSDEDNCECQKARPHFNGGCYDECNYPEQEFFNIDNNGNCIPTESCLYKIIYESNECVGNCPNGYCEFGDYCYKTDNLEDYNLSIKIDISSFQECQCDYNNKYKKNKLEEVKNKYECILLCPGDNHTYNDDTGECVTDCENNREYIEHDEDNNVIVRCSSKCGQEEYYDKDSNKCLGNCQEIQKYNYNNSVDGSKECMVECNIYNDDQFMCLTGCEDNEIILFNLAKETLDKPHKHCIPKDKSKFYYEYNETYFDNCKYTYDLFGIYTYPSNITKEDENQGICVEKCSMVGDKQFLDEGNCVEDCGVKFHYNKICLDNCFTSNNEHDYNLNFTIFNIYTDNNDGTEIKEITIEEEDYHIDDHECLKQCPIGTYIDDSNHKCYVSSCIDGTFINSNLECIDNCNIENNFIYNEKIKLNYIPKSPGEEKTNNIIRKYCLSSCPKTSPYYNIDEKECFSSECSVNKKYSAYDNPYICYNSCSSIGEEYKHEKDFICYKESVGCDKDYFYIKNNVKICADESDCLNEGYHYIQNKECVEKCNNNYYRIEPGLNTYNQINKLGSCLLDPQDCINLKYYYFNSNDKICNGTCNLYKTSPEITLNKNNETCFEECPNNYPYKDDVQKICVKNCDENKYIDGNQCIEKCDDSIDKKYHFENSRECVSSCKKDNIFYYYYQKEDNENICYYTCPSDAPFAIKIEEEQNNEYEYKCSPSCNIDSPFYYDDLKICKKDCEHYYNYDHTKCVYQCEPGEKINDKNCTKNCEYPNPYILKQKLSDSEIIVEKCVAECEDYLKSNKTNYCLTECPLDEKYEYNGFCYEQCPNGTYSDDYHNKCYNNKVKCPSDFKYYEYENGIYKCKQSCSLGKLYKEEGGECLDNCPDGYNYTGNDNVCLEKCSSKYGEYFEKYNNGYKCLKACPDDKLSVYDTKECLSTCPNDYYESPNKICYKSCKLDIEYPFSTINFNGSKKICSKKCNDSEPNYGDDNICTSTCSDSNLKIDYDGKCVSSCDNPYYKFNDNGKCVHKCPKYVNKNKECVKECLGDYNYIEDNECKKSCEEPNFAEKLGNTNMYECKTKCENDKYYYEEGNIFTVRKCFNGCGDDFNIQDTFICTTKCPSDYYSYYYVKNANLEITTYQNNTCVKKCPEDKPFINLLQCLPECPSEKKYHIEGDYNCISQCPEGSKIENNECKSECSDNKFLDNNQCVNSCTYPNIYYIEGSNKCVSKCGNGYYIEENKCVKSCSENNSFINETIQSCVNECQSKTYYINNTEEGSKKICVYNCPDYYCIDSNTSLIICKDECSYKFNDTKECRDKCEGNYKFYDYENGTCLDKCPENQFYKSVNENDSINIRCYTTCPNQYPYKNRIHHTCSDKCISGFFLDYTNKECVDNCNNRKTFEDNEIIYCLNDCKELGLFEYGSVCIRDCSEKNLLGNMETKKCECEKFFYLNESNEINCIDNCEGNEYKYRLYGTKQCLNNCSKYILSLDEKYCYEKESDCPQNTIAKPFLNSDIAQYKCDCSYKYYKLDENDENSKVCLEENEECPNTYKYIKESSSECIKECGETLRLGNICLNSPNSFKYWYFENNEYHGINDCSTKELILIKNLSQCVNKCNYSNYLVYPNVNNINECLSNCDDIPNTIAKRVYDSTKSYYECACIDLWYKEGDIIYCNGDTNKKTCAEAFKGKEYLIKETKECVSGCNDNSNYSFIFGMECFNSCKDIKKYYDFDAEEDKFSDKKECICPKLWKNEDGKKICINSDICYEENYQKLISDRKECKKECPVNYKELNNICYKECNGTLTTDMENENKCKCAYKWYRYNDNSLNVTNIIVCLGQKDECPKDFYPYLDNANQQCVESTSNCSSTIVFNYTCYNKCPDKTKGKESEHTCECDIDYGKWYQYTYEGKILYQCGLERCPDNKKYLDIDSQECKYTCENKYHYRNSCYTECPQNTKVIDELTKECVDTYTFEESTDLKSLEENIKTNIKAIYEKTTSNGVIYNINNSTMQLYGINKNKEDKKDVIMRNNLTYIDLSYCLDKLYEKNGLTEDTDIIIVKYDLAVKTNGSTINPVEFKVINSKTGQEIPLDACEDNSIVISYPLMNILNSFVTDSNNLRSLEEEKDKKNLNLREKFLKGKEIYIDNEEIDTFDLSNKLYTDICYPFKINGKDLILEDRLNYLYPFCSFCESNCIYNKTDFISERVYCNCNPKDQINFERQLELMNSNPNMEKTKKDQKASILKCLGKISEISKNFGFFYGLIIILAEIAMCILTFLYSYKVFVMRVNRKFSIKEDDNIINANTENLETVNLSGRDKYDGKNKNEEIIKTSERNLQHPPKNKKQIKVIEINEDKKEKRKDTKKKANNKKEDTDKVDIINIKNTEKDENFQRNKEEDRISTNSYNPYDEKSSARTFKESDDDNIFELIKLESTLLTVNYQKALQKNKAEILIMLLTEILDKIYIVKAIWFLQKYAIVPLYVSLYLLWHMLILSFLSLFYNYSNLHKIWIQDNYPNLNFHLSFGFLSCIISFFFYRGLCFLIFNDRKIAEIDSIPRENKNEINEKYNKMMFWAKIKIIIFYAVVFILCIIFFLYLMAFCGVNIGTKAKLFESYGIALIEVAIIKILYGIVLGILRKISLTYEIEKLYFIVRILDLYIS